MRKNDRGAIAVAAVVALTAVGGFTLYACHANSPAPRVLGLTVIEAIKNRGPVVRIQIAPSSALLRLADEGETWEYRVVEPSGRVYVTAINSDEHTRNVDVPYAYGRPAVNPRVEVWHDDQLLGWTGIGSLPPPRITRLHPEPNAPIRAFHVAAEAFDVERYGMIRLAPRDPIPSGEYWNVRVVRTPLEDRALGMASLKSGPPDKDGPDRTRLHYAEDVDALQVRVERWVHRSRSQRIVLHGLNLALRDGQTVIAWKGEHLPNSLGLNYKRWPDSKGYEPNFEIMADGKLQTVPGDARSPTLQFVEVAPKAPNLGTPQASTANLSPTNPWARFGERVSMKFENSDFHRLHLRRLLIGLASWQDSNPDLGPIDSRPFDVTLRITKEWNEKVGSFETTIPVEPAPNGANERL